MQRRLATGVVERQEEAAGPRQRPGAMRSEAGAVRREAVEGGQGHAAEANDDRGIDGFELAAQERQAAIQVSEAWPLVASGRVHRVAEDRVGDEDLVAAEAGKGEKGLEAPAGFVALEGNAAAAGAEPAGRLADEHEAGRA